MSDVIPDTTPELLLQSEQDRDELFASLHKNAHVGREELDPLFVAKPVEDPKKYMKAMLEPDAVLDFEKLDPSFKQIYGLIHERHGNEIKMCINIMTELANNGNPDDILDRKRYQQAAMRLFKFTRDGLIQAGHLDKENIDGNAMFLALNGAGALQHMLMPFIKDASNIDATQLKRLLMIDGSFMAGIGEIDLAVVEACEVAIFPDDCLSSAMTALAYLERFLELGGNPKKVIFMYTVGTYGGIQKIYEKANALMKSFGKKCEIVVAAAEICVRVNDEMYLLTADGKMQLVGNMGAWLKRIPDEEYPDGEDNEALEELYRWWESEQKKKIEI